MFRRMYLVTFLAGNTISRHSHFALLGEVIFCRNQVENRPVRISVIRVVLGRFISSCAQYCNLQNLYSWYIAILCYIFTLTNFTLSSKFYSNYCDGAEVKGNHCNRRLCKSPTA